MSYGPRQPEQWLYRAEGGVLVPFEPVRSDEVADQREIASLRGWWEANDRAPIYRETVRNCYREMFGKNTSRATATRVFELAIESGQVVKGGSAKNPGAKGFVFADRQGVKDAK
jgi:hypothetical protein